MRKKSKIVRVDEEMYDLLKKRSTNTGENMTTSSKKMAHIIKLNLPDFTELKVPKIKKKRMKKNEKFMFDF